MSSEESWGTDSVETDGVLGSLVIREDEQKRESVKTLDEKWGSVS